MEQIHFIDHHGSFTMEKPENTSYLYFPLASESGLKSCVTPNLGGDSKIDQESFLLEPVSSENLHNNRSTRNFWCYCKDKGLFSLTGSSSEQESDKFTERQDSSSMEAGFMWHTLSRSSEKYQLSSLIQSFIPVNDNVEILHITIQNTGSMSQEITPYAAIPIYGRSADNIRDHRNVTSMLHRIQTTPEGILVCPTMSFDEKGHRTNDKIYYVLGCNGDGEVPSSFYPTVEQFIGEGGSFTHPRAILEHAEGLPANVQINGREAMGAFAFEKTVLAPGESKTYILLCGIETSEEQIRSIYEKYHTSEYVLSALESTKNYWKEQVCVSFHTGNPDFDNWMKWVCFQPFLRRIFGCSFLPHHDYGRGGRGWRDLWQDCLSLLLMDPGNVGEMIENNYSGVRIDGTNATIIGSGQANFIADRNGIARVWMDHALWPLMTTQLYIQQTGDIAILNKEIPYFKDTQCVRGTSIDDKWSPDQGNRQLTVENNLYTGSILEHILIQQLAAFYEVGDHNIYRLRGADWNDALDMAAEHGESVAFTCAYAGNLKTLAGLIRQLKDTTSMQTVSLLKEIEPLLCSDVSVYDDIHKKQELLSNYGEKCRHQITGEHITVSLAALADNLDAKADWLMKHIKEQEWIDAPENEGWFNSYYDNHGRQVEYYSENDVRMMLTGQVFAVMSGTATDSQIQKIIKSADHYLYRKEIGGYRLNTDFKELKFDMGRMFGFAYGEKENGAVFSHMTVMYANALYQRGYAKEGWKALKTLADAALNFNTSHIYPGVPEYFRADGRGVYHYLTGAASWYMMTMITEVFGVRGKGGDLLIQPKLLADQFDCEGRCSINLPFAGKAFHIVFENKQRKEFGTYGIASASCNQTPVDIQDKDSLILPRTMIDQLSDQSNTITLVLD